MNKVDPKRVGLALAGLVGAVHASWVTLVVAGLTLSAVDYVKHLYLHFIAVSYGLEPFDVAAALTLIAVATLCGYVVGYLFSVLYNLLGAASRKKKSLVREEALEKAQ